MEGWAAIMKCTFKRREEVLTVNGKKFWCGVLQDRYLRVIDDDAVDDVSFNFFDIKAEKFLLTKWVQNGYLAKNGSGSYFLTIYDGSLDAKYNYILDGILAFEEFRQL